jgi:hypothetical protein
MPSAFVAVLCPGSWSELADCTEPDDLPALLFDSTRDEWPADELPAELSAEVDGVLSALAALDPASRVVVVTTRPVIDTLKLVDAEGTLTGTADRDEHRFVRTPIAVRLRLLREVAEEMVEPDPIAVLAALAARGAIVVPL